MGKQRNETETYSRNKGFAYQAEYDANNNIIYEGWATPSSSTASAVWQICKHTWTGSNLTATEWADGNDEFDNIWDNHTTLTYR